MSNTGDSQASRTVELQSNNIVRDENGVIIGRMQRAVEREEIVAAVAQAWCSKENEHKEMDATLAEEIIRNVWNIL